jgi:hypothetical protein
MGVVVCEQPPILTLPHERGGKSECQPSGRSRLAYGPIRRETAPRSD